VILIEHQSTINPNMPYNQQPRPEGTRYVVLLRYWSRV
jgi:hypothetical protein